jgi:hypothetical protein
MKQGAFPDGFAFDLFPFQRDDVAALGRVVIVYERCDLPLEITWALPRLAAIVSRWTRAGGEPRFVIYEDWSGYRESVFQVHGLDAADEVVIRRKLTRRRVLEFFEGLSPCLVGIKASSSSHY